MPNVGWRHCEGVEVYISARTFSIIQNNQFMSVYYVWRWVTYPACSKKLIKRNQRPAKALFTVSGSTGATGALDYLLNISSSTNQRTSSLSPAVTFLFWWLWLAFDHRKTLPATIKPFIRSLYYNVFVRRRETASLSVFFYFLDCLTSSST